MNYSVKINHANKLIHYQHRGQISRQEIGEVWDEFLTLEEFKINKYNIVSDYRNSTFIATHNDIEIICDILSSLEYILKGKKQALILDSPMNTALSVLFEGEANKRVGFIVKIFSTEEAALNWILG